MKIYNSQELYFPEANESLYQDWTTYIEDGGPNFTFWEAVDLGPGRSMALYHGDSGWARVSRRSGELLEDGFQDHGLDTPEGPVMNFWWPVATRLRMNESVAAVRLYGFNTCLIQLDDNMFGVALTGGGMDLSWDIAASFVALGFFPPTGLRIWQGSPSSTWQYGVSTIGEPWAKRVRAALRRRTALQVRQLRRDQTDLRAWR